MLVGESDSIEHFEREYRGFATPSTSGLDVVSCTRQERQGQLELNIEAGEAGNALPQVHARFSIPSAAPTELTLSWSEQTSARFRVRLGEGDSRMHYEYVFGVDAATFETSLCSVLVTGIDDESLAGTVACRGLVASFGSADGAVASEDVVGGRRAASATLDFSCPFHVLSAGGGGGSGGGASGGSGGTFGGAAGSGPGPGGMGGGGPAPKSCVGSSTPCSLRTELECEQGLGCTWEEECDGLSTSCYAQFGSYACISQQGCVWSSYNSNCSGSAWSCSLFSGSASCVSQEGCSWSADCTGVASSCTGLSEFACELEPGCRWE
jgi:hypothetical protein